MDVYKESRRVNSIQFGQPLGLQGVEDRINQLSSMLGLDSQPAADASQSFSNALTGAIGSQGFAPLVPGKDGTNIENSTLKSLIQSSAASNGIDPNLFDALVEQESGYQPNARSRAGAMGLTQIMPETANAMGITSPFNPTQNLEGGARYLKSLMNQFNSLPLALAAYNAGPEAVIKHGGIPPYPETIKYVQNILAGYERRKQL